MCWLGMSPNDTRFILVDRLNAEWEALNGDGWMATQYRADVACWSVQDPAFAGCRCPTDVLAKIRREPDEVLRSLIGLYQACGPAAAEATADNPRRQARSASADGELAGRIVLQTMLGKLVLMARRDHQHSIEDYVGTLWAQLGRYRLDRRPNRIAANLALDTLKEVSRDEVLVQLIPTGCDLDLHRQDQVDEPVPSMEAHRVLETAWELGFIDRDTRRLLVSVYADGLSGRQAAVAFGLSPTTVRYRCSKAVRTLAKHAQTLALAA